jgi:hypothetical protein
MKQRFLLPVPLAILTGLLLGVPSPEATAEPSPAPAVDFNRDVRPILAKNCFACHGPDGTHRHAGLRLDQRESAVKKRGRSAAVVPGQPEQSLVYNRITAKDVDERMPPKETGNVLTPAQVATLRRWIEQGAQYAEHWAFVKPQRPALPEVKDRSWPRNGVDYFVLAALERAGLKPSEQADKFSLLRRASLDLRGLPPTPQEVDAFAADTSPDAYEKAVDRFLNDSAYGERWARMWLDLARYADSAGYGSDPLRPNIWRYRDWVIDAFNRNLPYDQFTVEQLAGDLLPNPTLEQKIATAFPPQHDDQHGGRHRPRRVPRRRRQGPGRYHAAGLDGPDDGLRQVPQSQVRPDHEQGVLPVLRLLQPDGRQRPARRAADHRRPDADPGRTDPADRRPAGGVKEAA